MQPDWSPEKFRALLRLQVRLLNLDPRLRRRFDDSDLIQETLLKAHRHRDQCRAASEAELIGWLRAILANVVADRIDAEHAAGRDIDREQSLQAVQDSSVRLEKFLTRDHRRDREPSPSEVAERRELLLRIAAEVEQLPADQREAFVRIVVVGTPVAQVALELGRTEKAVAGLLFRARRKLAAVLTETGEANPSPPET